MDPSFLFITTSLLQQNQINQAIAAQAREERERISAEEELRENKRQWMAQVQEETKRIVREDTKYPIQSFMQVQVLLSDMVAYEVNPDAFEDLKDKEDVALLWRKLKSLYTTLDHQLSESQKGICQRAVDATFTRRLIRYAAPRIAAFEYWEEINAERDQVSQRNHKLLRTTKIVWGIAVFVLVAVFGLVSVIRGMAFAVNLLAFWFLASICLVVLLVAWYDKKKPKGLHTLEMKCRDSYAKAELDNEEFWNTVRKTFDGIPKSDQLPRFWDEQETALQAIDKQ
jgi:hypothetical protein